MPCSSMSLVTAWKWTSTNPALCRKDSTELLGQHACFAQKLLGEDVTYCAKSAVVSKAHAHFAVLFMIVNI